MGILDKQFSEKEKNIFDQISELLTGKGIQFSRAQHDNALFQFEANVDERVIQCILVCDIYGSLISFAAYLQKPIPEEKLPEILEFITRINRDIWYGSFQINFEGDFAGYVRCKTTLPIDNAIVSYEQLERLCFNNLLHVNNYQNGFSQILNKNLSPKDALEEIRLAIKYK
jgi:hypothetical protein